MKRFVVVFLGRDVVRITSAPDANMGHAIRALKASGAGVEERVVACGRTELGEVVVSKDQVVWTEPGKGVFVAPR